MKAQEFLQEWEKKNNPFYPEEMKWDRLKVNLFAKDFDDESNRLEKLVMPKIAGIIDKEIADYEREIKIWNNCLEPEESTKPIQDRKNIIGILKALKLKIASNFSA